MAGDYNVSSLYLLTSLSHFQTLCKLSDTSLLFRMHPITGMLVLRRGIRTYNHVIDVYFPAYNMMNSFKLIYLSQLKIYQNLIVFCMLNSIDVNLLYLFLTTT